MSADELVKDVRVTGETLSIDLMDRRTITVALAWYPRLVNVGSEHLARWEIAGAGHSIHWPELDQDLGTKGLPRGAPAAASSS